MTEQEWSVCGEPYAMLRFLEHKASHRKMRLFACACCRRIWDLLEETCRTAIQTAEQFADDAATTQELQGTADAVVHVFDQWYGKSRLSTVELYGGVMLLWAFPLMSRRDDRRW